MRPQAAEGERGGSGRRSNRRRRRAPAPSRQSRKVASSGASPVTKLFYAAVLGFLLEDRGWRLSPAYDLNPNPETAGALSLCIDRDDATADFSVALRQIDVYRAAFAL